MTAPPVSVVIVNHTRRAELALTLKALDYQRYRNFEVIVVSDMNEGARPRSPLAPRWHRFADTNISAARNIGLADAAGDLIAFCDDDAQPDFNWLEDLVPCFADPRVGAAGGWVRGRNGVSFQWRTVHFDPSGSDIATDSASEPRVYAPEPGRVVKTVGTNAMFRRQALAQVGGFDEGFRFYLDEADVNMRLARAGWSTAIVPGAQVYHGYAAGPYRSALRVPQDLFEIGASQAFFAAKHLAGPPPTAKQRREQTRRLDRLFALGLLDASRLRWLMSRYDAGRAEGAERASHIPALAPSARGLTAQPARPDAAPLLLTAPMGRLAQVSAQAAEAAATGREVTVIAEDWPWRRLRVRFHQDGFFLHKFGRLGRAAPLPAFPRPGFRRQVAAEARRVAPFRHVPVPT